MPDRMVVGTTNNKTLVAVRSDDGSCELRILEQRSNGTYIHDFVMDGEMVDDLASFINNGVVNS